jgi:preprotein translocase subunit SecG
MKKYFKIFTILFIVGILLFLKISSEKKQKEKELIKKS